MPHIHEKVDFTSEVFIVYKDKVLLRKHDKYKIWLSVGGHVEPEDDPNQAAVREVKEEVGLDVELYDSRKFIHEADGYRELIPPQFMNRHRISDTHEHVTMTYFAVSTTDALDADIVKEVSDELRWFSKEELTQLEQGISEPVRYYALSALETCTNKIV